MVNSFAYRAVVVSAVLCLIPSSMFAQRGGRGAGAGAADAAAAVPTPQTADGHPDLNGLWNGGGGGGIDAEVPDATNPDYDKTDAKGFAPRIIATRGGSFTNFERDGMITGGMGSNKPLYKPQYWDAINIGVNDKYHGDPSYNCMPPGVPRLGPPAFIQQTPKFLMLVYSVGAASSSPPTYRMIPTDGRKHTNLEDLDGTWNGESIGHWEGDTMVIDSIGFTADTWLGRGYLHTENMHVIERLRRKGNTLTWQATVEDPDVLMAPWAMDPRTVRLNPDPNAMLAESGPCSERDVAHVVKEY